MLFVSGASQEFRGLTHSLDRRIGKHLPTPNAALLQHYCRYLLWATRLRSFVYWNWFSGCRVSVPSLRFYGQYARMVLQWLLNKSKQVKFSIELNLVRRLLLEAVQETILGINNLVFVTMVMLVGKITFSPTLSWDRDAPAHTGERHAVRVMSDARSKWREY